MEPEGSLPHSQVSTTCPYPEPDQFSPLHHIPLPENSIYTWISQGISFPQVSPPKRCYATPLHNTRYMPHPSHSSQFYHPNYWVEYRSLCSSLCSFLHSRYLLPLRPKYSPQYPQYKQSSCTHKTTTGKFIVQYILIFKFLDSKLQDKRFCTE